MAASPCNGVAMILQAAVVSHYKKRESRTATRLGGGLRAGGIASDVCDLKTYWRDGLILDG